MRSLLGHVLDELRGRPWQGLTVAGVTALVALLCATIVWLLAEREREVMATMDRADLPLVVVPAGTGATDRQRFLFSGGLETSTLEALSTALRGDLRVYVARRVVMATIAGRRLPLIGLDAEGQRRFLGTTLAPREVLPGALAVERLGAKAGGSIEWRGVHWVWERSLPEQGTPEDRAIFVRRSDLDEAFGDAQVSEVLLSPRAGVSVDEIARRIRSLDPSLDVIYSPVRGSEAERETLTLLSMARRLVLLVAAALLALAAGAWTSLEIRRGRREATVLTAIGASPPWIIGVLATRATLLGSLGGLFGLLLPIAWLAASGSLNVLPWLLPDFGTILGLAALVPGVATFTVAAVQARRGLLTILELQPAG